MLLLAARSLWRTWLLALCLPCPSFAFISVIKQVFGSAVMGDLLLNIPIRLQCVGSGRDFTKFLLYTRVRPDEHQLLQPGNLALLTSSDFDPASPTKMVVHGFLDNFYISDWMQRMKSALLSEGDYNVILVDWSCGNEFPYFQAVQNSKITAEELKNLVLFLRDATGADPSSFHLIGHSLGSHIAALVGHRIPHLGRISALDPAGPKFYEAPLEDRLDPTDAEFVDVIHTDGGNGLLEGLGLHLQQGHVDFYPNGGRNQPGCNSSPFDILPRIGIHRAARYYITCDHFRSIDFYIDSIAPVDFCDQVGVACRDWDTFAQGRCADCRADPYGCAPMGYHSNLYAGRDPHAPKREFFLKTADVQPYCLFQYQVIVETGCNGSYCQDLVSSRPGFSPGAIRLEVKTQGGKTARFDLKEKTETVMKPGSQYVYLATNRFPVGEVESAKVFWGPASVITTEVAGTTTAFPGLRFSKIQVVPISLYEQKARSFEPQVTVLCGSDVKSAGNNLFMDLGINSC